MDRSRVALLGVLFVGCVASACTAIVGAKLSDTSDYGTADTPGSSGSSGANDPCSLLADRYGDQADANACSDCITTNCKDPVGYFCTNGTPASYFSTLQNCAQNPWNGRAPPNSGASFYECDMFATPIEVPNDPGSEGAHEAVAHNCITSSCLAGDAPPCRLCEVSIQKPGSGNEVALLRDNQCGACLVDKCAAALSTCCDSQPMNDFVQYCAYPQLSTNKAACLELGNAVPDAGQGSEGYSTTDMQCLSQLQACFTSCKATCAAVTTGTQ